MITITKTHLLLDLLTIKQCKMNSKQAKELYAQVEELDVLRHTFNHHPECKKKFLNFLKSQDHVTDKPEYYLRNLCKATSKDVDLSSVEWTEYLKAIPKQ